MYRTQYDNTRRVPDAPQSTVSIVEPNQAPSLRYIMGVLQSGGSLNVRMAMEYDNSPTFDDVTIRDTRHLTPSDLDGLLTRFTPPEPPAPSPEPAPTD